jgi:1-acyl-sn-glycerol-3-phosphate acyltransferase
MSGNRRIARGLTRQLLKTLLPLVARIEVRGLENCPPGGPLIVALNHLAHIDAPLAMATLPYELEAIALADLYRVPVTGQLLRLYGTIPVHRGEYDREVIRQALSVLAEGKVLALAPEARMSVTGALERARDGVAWLAVHSRAPILPVAVTGTEKAYAAWRRRRRPRLTLSVGPVYPTPEVAESGAARREQIAQVTDEVMHRIAAMLPPEYQGVYAE